MFNFNPLVQITDIPLEKRANWEMAGKLYTKKLKVIDTSLVRIDYLLIIEGKHTEIQRQLENKSR
jgi:hypothetical protein